MVIQSTRQGNSIYDEMKTRVFQLHMTERQSAYETYTADDELAETLGISEDDYNFNLSKLDVLASMARYENLQKRFIQQKMYIDQMDISEKNKIEAILTSACILEKFGLFLIGKHTSEEELHLLARVMTPINPSEYLRYQTLIIYNFDNLITLLKNFEFSPIEQAKQYLKSQNN